MAGCPVVVNRAVLLLVTTKVSVCPASSGGPAEMAVAQPVTVFGPESSQTVWSAPLVNVGAFRFRGLGR